MPERLVRWARERVDMVVGTLGYMYPFWSELKQACSIVNPARSTWSQGPKTIFFTHPTQQQ